MNREMENLHFLMAVIHNDEEMVLESIKAGVNIESVYKGKSTLFYAVSIGNNKIVEALIEAGANVNITDEEGKTPLFYCAEKHSRKSFLLRNRMPLAPGFDYNSVASTLIKAGADVNIADSKNKTVLIYSLQDENLSLAWKLIDSGADVKTIDEYGRNALFYHSVYENPNMLQKILSSVDINSTDHFGQTALMDAVEENQESAVDELIKAGADVNVIDENGKTALMYCTQHQLSDGHMHIPSYDDYQVISERKKHILSMLIKAGADINRRDNLGKTSLIYCVQKQTLMESFYSHESIQNTIDFKGFALAELIKSGADVNMTDNKGKSALIYALQYSNNNLAYTLLRAGADGNITDEEGRTALIYFAPIKSREREIIHSYTMSRYYDSDHPGSDTSTSDHNTIACMLIKACSDVNKIDKDGKSALMYSLIYGNKRLASALIKAGADVNIPDKEGKTALMYSLQNGNESLTCALLEAGADVSITDKKGKTALIYCAENQKERMHPLQECLSSSNSSGSDTATQSRVASILITSCADMNKTDNEGKTALIYSLQEGNESLACALIEAGANVNIIDDDGKTALFYDGCPILTN